MSYDFNYEKESINFIASKFEELNHKKMASEK